MTKNIFSLRKSENIENEVQTESIDSSMPINEWGWTKAKSMNGSITGLKVCLQQIFQDYRRKVRNDKAEQEKAKQPYLVKLQERKGDIEIYQNRLEKINKEELPELNDKIAGLQEDIINIKSNPEDITGVKRSNVGFYIGLTILAFITIYLFVFYSSASYSAFFKEFEPSSAGVVSAIFDAQALSKAFSGGVFQGILILTLPFLFLGLGYIIDEINNRKDKLKVAKIGAIIAVTFIFDAILAYVIEQKIYDLQQQGSFNEMPDFTISYAVTSVEFWLIIFAGFVAYIIWGLIFSFVMEAYENMDKVLVAIRAKKQEIEQVMGKIENKKEEKSKLDYKIGENKREIEKLNEILNQTDFVDYKQLENRLVQFFDGWLEWMNANKEKEPKLVEAHEVVKIFISNNLRVVE